MGTGMCECMCVCVCVHMWAVAKLEKERGTEPVKLRFLKTLEMMCTGFCETLKSSYAPSPHILPCWSSWSKEKLQVPRFPDIRGPRVSSVVSSFMSPFLWQPAVNNCGQVGLYHVAEEEVSWKSICSQLENIAVYKRSFCICFSSEIKQVALLFSL